MTDTKVTFDRDGRQVTLRVVESAKAKSTLWKDPSPELPKGRQIYFENTLELLLEDGSVIYGCRLCGKYVNEKIGRIRTHQSYDCEFRKPRVDRETGIATIFERAEEEKKPVKKPAAKRSTPEDSEWVKSAKKLVPQDPPPTEYDDILAALRVALSPTPDTGKDELIAQLTAEKEALDEEKADLDVKNRTLVLANQRLTEERDWWKGEYKTVCDAMTRVGEMVRQVGFK